MRSIGFTTPQKEHRCKEAEKHGALYFYSPLWNSWGEKYTEGQAAEMGVITTAIHCKYCGVKL